MILSESTKTAIEYFKKYHAGIRYVLKKKKLNVTICEDYSVNPIEYGLSFTNFNPEPEDYFKMVDEETANRLANYLNKL